MNWKNIKKGLESLVLGGALALGSLGITGCVNKELTELRKQYPNTKIVFTLRKGNSQIYEIDINGKIRKFHNSKYNELYPAFSPDGKKIAFVSDRDGSYQIHTMNTDGTEQKRLTNSSS